jgi:snRNA-activating protein complex subunit 3
MEEVYKPKFEEITIPSEYFFNYKVNLLPIGVSQIPQNDQGIASAINFQGTEKQFQEILDTVDLDQQLQISEEVDSFTFQEHKVNTTTRNTDLPRNCMKFKCVEKATKWSKGEKRVMDCKIRYNKHRYREIKTTTINLEPYKEQIYTIRLYEPFKYKVGLRLGHPKFQQEFLVLGSQLLTDLRDKIFCVSNYGPFRDVSDNLEAEFKTSGDPGFFFIHDTFYNDLRNPDNLDYSDVIRKWARGKKCIKPLRTALMEDKKFDDLTFRLGYPQVYQHCGNCEHVFVISDVRLLAPSDCLTKDTYPILRSYANNRTATCNICAHFEPNYVVTNSERQIFDPSHLCELCFTTYHYKRGQKIGQFQAYRYYSPKVVPKD